MHSVPEITRKVPKMLIVGKQSTLNGVLSIVLSSSSIAVGRNSHVRKHQRENYYVYHFLFFFKFKKKKMKKLSI